MVYPRQSDRVLGDRRPPIEQPATPRALTAEESIFELPGEEPLWIWAHTCQEPRCGCREAMVLANTESREALLQQIGPLLDAWQAREAAEQFEGLTAFYLDVDRVLATDLKGNPLAPLAAHPQVAAVVSRIHGDVLDAIARLWYVGKGYPDQRQLVLKAPTVSLSNWRRGDRVAYDDIFGWVRRDVYFVEENPDEPFEAFEMYCVTPGCTCAEMCVVFARHGVEGLPGSVGFVQVDFAGAAAGKPDAGQEALLDRLWTAFRARHPAYLERFAARDADMKHIGSRMPALRAGAVHERQTAGLQPHRLRPDSPAVQLRAGPKVGRNDPCPCGSGKKYKKCCAGATA